MVVLSPGLRTIPGFADRERAAGEKLRAFDLGINPLLSSNCHL
jgi:hypothetical protein